MTKREYVNKAARKWLRHLYRTTDMSGGLWDWPTLGVCRLGMYSAGRRLIVLMHEVQAEELKTANCATGAEG